jgi:hypothetical protein
MRKIVLLIALAGLPSLLTARPTLSIYLDDNEPGVGIRPRQAIDFCAAGVYGWLGRLDLLQITRTHTPPLYPHLLSKYAIDCLEGPTSIPPGPSVPYRPLDTIKDRNLPRLMVLELVGERQPIEPTLSVKMATFPRYP